MSLDFNAALKAKVPESREIPDLTKKPVKKYLHYFGLNSYANFYI
jgi:hypothetical protein